MQILQWLFKNAHEHQTGNKQDQEVSSSGIVLVKNYRGKKRAEQTRLKCKNFTLFNLVRRKDIAKAYFYSTLHLKRLGSHRRRQHFAKSMNMKRENLSRGLSPNHHNKSDNSSSAYVGSTKVLPISNDHSPQTSTEKKDKDKAKSDKRKTISKMKELLRWAAATKSGKGENFLSRKALHFRNKATLKAVPDDDQLSNDSPKISFRWDLESCSTISSNYSGISMASSTKNDQSGKTNILNPSISNPGHENECGARTGNWITTDSEFVVLEL